VPKPNPKSQIPNPSPGGLPMTYLPKPHKITSIKNYTKDVKLFRIKCSLNPCPGTFLEVSVPGIGECPLASCSHDKNYIELLTRNAGNVTSAIFNLKKDDTILIRGPHGHGFPVEDLKNKNLILIAGGTGIAPITSMINYIEQNKKCFKKIFIYFGFRDEECILLANRIEKWKKEFELHIGLSQKSESHKYEVGFINEIMEHHKPDTKNTSALLCGPEVMMDCATKELNKLGVKNKDIYWSLERRMECAFGSCGRCQIQDLYVCKDGPIFRYDKIKSRLDNENSSNKKK
jgi:anaerobic sulfite reductase subunit B